MHKIITRIIPTLFFWAVFAYIILQVPYPDSLTQANTTQLLSFFVPLFLAITFSANIFIKNIFISVSVSLGIISSLFLKALDSLNLVTAILVIISTGLLVSYFRKIKKRNLTKWPKIHRLTRLRKENG